MWNFAFAASASAPPFRLSGKRPAAAGSDELRLSPLAITPEGEGEWLTYQPPAQAHPRAHQDSAAAADLNIVGRALILVLS
jgi:hypothetical protein